MMLDKLQRRNYSQSTVRSYIHVIEDFSKHFHRSPDRLGPDHIRQYQASVPRFTSATCLAWRLQLWIKVTRVTFWPVLASKTCKSVPFRTRAAISSRLM